MGLVEHALQEFRASGWVDENGKFKHCSQRDICDCVVNLLAEFSEQGHSGSTASYVINLFNRLAQFKPIAPLTGESWEWTDVDHCFQNKRRSSVFKDKLTGEAYDIDGKVFWSWARRPLTPKEAGYPGTEDFKSYYSCFESRVPVTFPYVVPDSPTYEFRASDSDLPQTIEGIL